MSTKPKRISEDKPTRSNTNNNKDRNERKIKGRNLTRKLTSDNVVVTSGTDVGTPSHGQNDVDECAAGGNHTCPPGITFCVNTLGSYKCLCIYNGRRLEPNQECKPSSIFTESPVENGNRSEGVISHKDLQRLYQPTENNELTSSTLIPNIISGHVESGPINSSSMTDSSATTFGNGTHSPIAMTLAVTLSGASCVLIVLLLLCWLRRQKKRYPQDASTGLAFWCDCLWQRPKNGIGLQALGKTSVLDNQTFTANPNYYSAPPEMAILKSLMHLEIAGDRLAFLDVIGEGCFGKVFKGVLRKNESELCDVAIKILKENSTSEIQVDFLREVEIMSSFNHENILALLGVVVVESGATPWMVFEFMEYGDLAELLRENTPYFWSTSSSNCKITKDDLPWLATQVASGMTYLSSQHFVHRDLATRNCLVGKGPMIKISDFGMSRDIYTSDYYKIGGSRMLPVRWMAPESVMYGKFTLETDVWSFGVVLWEIFAFGKQPYYGHSNEEVVKLIRQGILLSPPEECPHFVCQLMEMCWRTNPYDRIKFAQIYDILISHCHPDRAKRKSTLSSEIENVINEEVRISCRLETNIPRSIEEASGDASYFNNYLVPRTAVDCTE